MTVCGGVAIGPVRLRGWELDRPVATRVPAAEIDSEVERFRRATQQSRADVESLEERMKTELGEVESRILAVHLAYLTDPVFLQDVENKIRSDQLRLEDALARVVKDFDRIFELVENERLKERALDLRDVALRVIRNLDETEADLVADAGVGSYILAVEKLSVADLLRLDHNQVLGILAEGGGVDSHAGILARSMRIPTVTGVPGLRDQLRDGDVLIVDASTGVVLRNPDTKVLAEYEAKEAESRRPPSAPIAGPVELRDGTRFLLYGTCGNLGEVTQAIDAGLDGVGVYRTELLFVVDRNMPSEDLLVRHYGEVLARAGDLPVCFRLLDLGGDISGRGGGPRHGPNPSLGLKGIRFLLCDQPLLRLQLRALLRVAPGNILRLAVPFVTSVQDVVRVRAAIREECASLHKIGVPFAEEVRVGSVIEVPAAALHLRSIAAEADFLTVAVDDLKQFILAADRDNLDVIEYYGTQHPALFELLAAMADAAREADREILLFGESAADPLFLPFFVGAGFEALCVSPVRSAECREVLSRCSPDDARELCRSVLAAPTSLDVQRVLLGAGR